MMPIFPWRKFLPILCPALASLCLGLGYQWTGALALVLGLLAFLIFMLARRSKALWVTNLGLGGVTAAAVYGLVEGASLAWMLLAVSLALASWDILLLEARLAGNPADAPTAPLERAHFISLGLALTLALLAALLGQLIRLQIPFIVMLGLVVLVYFSLNWLLRSLTE